MRFKKTVATSLVVVAISVSLIFKAGCGNGFLGLEDYQRELLFGGLAAAILFGQDAPADTPGAGNPVPGAQGDVGPAGQQGADGLNCWDTNGNGLADVDTEDFNGDGVVDAGDCLGQDGAAGASGDSTPIRGLDCWDLNGNGTRDAASEDANGDGTVDVFDCRGEDGADGAAGADGGSGSTGAPGSAGADGADGAAGPNDFTVFVDDFFTVDGSPTGELDVNVVSIQEPALGGDDLNPKTDVRIAYRVAIPQTYRADKPVTMRLTFGVTGEALGACMDFTVDTARLRHNSSMEQGAGQRWVRIDSGLDNSPPGRGNGGESRTTVVVDLPINQPGPDGLEYWMDMAVKDFLAFELQTTTFDGRTYHLVGVEFFSRDAAAVVNAEIFNAEPAPCSTDCTILEILECDESPACSDCNENSIPDRCDIRDCVDDPNCGDCNGNGVPDGCEPPSSLEGVWRFEFSADVACDLFQEFFTEIRYLRFDDGNQLVENWIEVDQGEGCINFPYPSVDQPNLISYRFFFGLVTNDTSRQILSSEVNGVCGTFGFTEQVQVGRACDGEDGVTDVSGSFIDDNNLAGSWEFQTSPDSIDDGLNCNPNTLERVCGSFEAVRVNGPPDCFIVNGCDDCNLNGICDDIEITSSVFLTTLDSATGAPIGTFSVGLVTDQFVPFIEVDASANIWVGRKNTSHGSNEPSPDDMVAQFTSTGTLLQTVKGPMHDPISLAVDSLGNIYVGGSPDGGSLIVSRIYKYDSNGVFLMSFGELTGAALGAGYTVLEFAPGDRLFATTGNPHRVYEYTTAGVQIRVVSSFDGAARRGGGLALSPDGLSLWNYQPRNGPGEDFIVQYDLDLTILSTFGMNSLGNPSLWGMDTLPSGNLVARSGSKVIEISPTGTLIREIDFSAIDGGGSLRRGFAVDNSGNFLVNHAGLDVSDCNRNSILDECDISADPSLDGNLNGILDSCEDD